MPLLCYNNWGVTTFLNDPSNTPPSISAISDQSIPEDSSVAVPFTISDWENTRRSAYRHRLVLENEPCPTGRPAPHRHRLESHAHPPSSTSTTPAQTPNTSSALESRNTQTSIT